MAGAESQASKKKMWVMICGVLAVIWVALLAYFFVGGGTSPETRKVNGQLLVIDPATGNIDGAVRHLATDDAAKKEEAAKKLEGMVEEGDKPAAEGEEEGDFTEGEQPAAESPATTPTEGAAKAGDDFTGEAPATETPKEEAKPTEQPAAEKPTDAPAEAAKPETTTPAADAPKEEMPKAEEPHASADSMADFSDAEAPAAADTATAATDDFTGGETTASDETASGGETSASEFTTEHASTTVEATISLYPRTAASLAIAPAPKLVEKTESGTVLPKIAEDGTRPWQHYARPHTAPEKPEEKKPLVAIIIRQMGADKGASDTAMQLPLEVSLGFSPYAPDSKALMESARNLGHEAWVELPMEPKNYPASDPGPLGLMRDLPAETNLARLRDVLAKLPGYVGVMTPEEEAFSGNEQSMQLVVDELRKRGLVMVYATSDSTQHTGKLASSNKEVVLTPDVVLGRELSKEAIEKAFTKLEGNAKQNGYAVAVIHGYPALLQKIAEWSKAAPQKGLQLAPLSAIVNARTS